VSLEDRSRILKEKKRNENSLRRMKIGDKDFLLHGSRLFLEIQKSEDGSESAILRQSSQQFKLSDELDRLNYRDHKNTRMALARPVNMNRFTKKHSEVPNSVFSQAQIDFSDEINKILLGESERRIQAKPNTKYKTEEFIKNIRIPSLRSRKEIKPAPKAPESIEVKTRVYAFKITETTTTTTTPKRSCQQKKKGSGDEKSSFKKLEKDYAGYETSRSSAEPGPSQIDSGEEQKPKTTRKSSRIKTPPSQKHVNQEPGTSHMDSSGESKPKKTRKSSGKKSPPSQRPLSTKALATVLKQFTERIEQDASSGRGTLVIPTKGGLFYYTRNTFKMQFTVFLNVYSGSLSLCICRWKAEMDNAPESY
jgi:hypothetical protein